MRAAWVSEQAAPSERQVPDTEGWDARSAWFDEAVASFWGLVVLLWPCRRGQVALLRYMQGWLVARAASARNEDRGVSQVNVKRGRYNPCFPDEPKSLPPASPQPSLALVEHVTRAEPAVRLPMARVRRGPQGGPARSWQLVFMALAAASVARAAESWTDALPLTLVRGGPPAPLPRAAPASAQRASETRPHNRALWHLAESKAGATPV